MRRFPISEKIAKFNSVFNKNGFKLYVVGGAVRDYLLGIENHDYDFCTDALPDQVVGMFKNTIPTGIKHGTVTVLFKGESYEVTTFRTESDYSDNRHPDKVSFVRNLTEDLSRRDFTINAFAADCSNGKIIDLYNGKLHLLFKKVKAIGNPSERFNEDALRLMRLARFCSKLQFKAEKKTFEAARQLPKLINNVSEERICDELFKILMTKKPSIGLLMLLDTGILKEILPEVTDCLSIKQVKFHASNVLEHTFNAVDAAADAGCNLTVRFACLLHDIGKVKTMVTDDTGAVRFHHHGEVSGRMAVSIMKRLKCSNKMIDDVSIIVSNHMVKYESNWTDGAVKRFINRIGEDNINNLFALQFCDQIASEGYSKESEYKEFIDRIEKCLNEPLSVKDLKINGNRLFELGIPKSKEMKDILNKLLEEVLDNPALNDEEYLEKEALSLFKGK